MRTKSKNVVIAGCARNCRKYLDDVFRNIDRISELFNTVKVLVSTDDSNDGTESYLTAQCEISKKAYDLIVLPQEKPLSSWRTVNIANARNRILDYLKDNDSTHYDYMIMMDLDDVCSKPIHIDALLNAFDNESAWGWDSLSFNNEAYYDFWALSLNKYHYSCWHTGVPEKTIHLMSTELKHMMKTVGKEQGYIECDSAFNGFAIYRYPIFKDIRYQTLMDFTLLDAAKIHKFTTTTGMKIFLTRDKQGGNANYDCEHRYFHLYAKKYLNSKILISYDSLF